MKIFSRSTLKRVFGGDPAAVAEFERLDALLSTVDKNGRTLAQMLEATLALIPEGESLQPASAILDALAAVPAGGIGVFERTGLTTVILRPVDAGDDASLLSRVSAMSYLGKGATSARPTPSAARRGVYFDTTLAALGKPTFWTGTDYVDATGAAV